MWIVIPGRCNASNYDVQLHIGESRDSGSGAGAPSRNDGVCFVALPSAIAGTLSIILQYLEHPAGGGDTAAAGRHLCRREDQAAGGADHARRRYQDLADFGAIDEMGV